jgi:hypothetical protein
MKRLLCSLAGLLSAATIAQADTLAQWTFESSFAGISGTSASITGIAPESTLSGITGVASGSHSLATSVWSSPAGDVLPPATVSSHSFSANNWTQTSDYFQFAVNLDLADYTYSGVNLTWDQTGSNTGPKTWGLFYSTDGNNYTQLGSDYALSFFSWNATTQVGNHESADFTSVVTLDTANTMYFRIVDDSPAATGSIVGAAVGTGGTDRIDNFTVSAIVTTVPEPTTLCLLGGFGLLAWTMIRRRK